MEGLKLWYDNFMKKFALATCMALTLVSVPFLMTGCYHLSPTHGVIIIFNVEGNPTDGQIESTIDNIREILGRNGFIQFNISQQLTDTHRQIRLQVAGTGDVDDLMRLIGEPATVTIRKTEYGDDFIRRQDITGVISYQTVSFDWGVRIHLTTLGAQLFTQAINEMMEEGTGQFYVMLNGEVLSRTIVLQVEPVLGHMVTIAANMTHNEAEQLRTRIESGLFEATLTLYSIEVAAGGGGT